MPRTVGKAILLLRDIWEAYAEELLKKHPDWWSKRENKIRHFRIGCTDEQGKQVEMHSYVRFRKTIEYYFDRAKQAIIDGKAVNMGSHVGKICAKRVERDFRKKKHRRVDWGKTRQQDKVWDEQRQALVYPKFFYHNGNDWSRIGWVKFGMLANSTVYEFKPAAANSARTSGFKLEFTQAQRKDPLKKYQYLFNPIKLKNGIHNNVNRRGNRKAGEEHETDGHDIPGEHGGVVSGSNGVHEDQVQPEHEV